MPSCKSLNAPNYIATVYIDPSISDDAFQNGSKLNPFQSWLDIDKHDLWKTGYRYLQKRGTEYRHTLWLHNKVNGSMESPIFIGAYGEGEKPIINSNGQYAISLRDCNNWIIQDFELKGAKYQTLFLYADKADVYNIKVLHCFIDGSSLQKKSGHHCIHIRNELRSIDSNHVYNIELAYNTVQNAGDKDLNSDGINLTAVKSHAYIHHNYISNNSGNGIDIAGGNCHIIEYNKCINNSGSKAHGQAYRLTNILIDNNIIVQYRVEYLASFGLSLQDSYKGVLRNNTVYLNNLGMGALILSSPNHPEDFKNNSINSNVFYGSRRKAACVRIFPEIAQHFIENNNIISNNIISNNKKAHLMFIQNTDKSKDIIEDSLSEKVYGYFKHNYLVVGVDLELKNDYSSAFRMSVEMGKVLLGDMFEKNKIGISSNEIDTQL
jgi:hypothetical protein